MKKFVSIVTAAAAAAALSVSASALTIDKDLGTLWSYDGAPKISGEEFADVTPDTLITLTFEANKDLANMAGHEYWCIKPLTRNEGGDYFIEGLEAFDGLTLSDSKDSYGIDPEATSVSFKLSEQVLEDISYNVLIFMGHGVTLKELTFSDGDAPSTPADTTPSDSTTTPANPDSGVESLAVVAGAGALALGAMIVARKKK